MNTSLWTFMWLSGLFHVVIPVEIMIILVELYFFKLSLNSLPVYILFTELHLKYLNYPFNL